METCWAFQVQPVERGIRMTLEAAGGRNKLALRKGQGFKEEKREIRRRKGKEALRFIRINKLPNVLMFGVEKETAFAISSPWGVRLA